MCAMTMPRSMAEMLTMLADLPEEEGAFRQEEMLSMFYSMPAERAAAMMRPMVEAMAHLAEDQQRCLIDSQMRILATFAAQKRVFLLRVHMAALAALPGPARERNHHLMHDAVDHLSVPERQVMVASMREVLADGTTQAAPGMAQSPPSRSTP